MPLQISLGPAQLDVEAALMRQRIELKSVPKGSAKIVFTARDFGHFLAHPLMQRAAATAVQVSLTCKRTRDCHQTAFLMVRLVPPASLFTPSKFTGCMLAI